MLCYLPATWLPATCLCLSICAWCSAGDAAPPVTEIPPAPAAPGAKLSPFAPQAQAQPPAAPTSATPSGIVELYRTHLKAGDAEKALACLQYAPDRVAAVTSTVATLAQRAKNGEFDIKSVEYKESGDVALVIIRSGIKRLGSTKISMELDAYGTVKQADGTWKLLVEGNDFGNKDNGLAADKASALAALQPWSETRIGEMTQKR